VCACVSAIGNVYIFVVVVVCVFGWVGGRDGELCVHLYVYLGGWGGVGWGEMLCVHVGY